MIEAVVEAVVEDEPEERDPDERDADERDRDEAEPAEEWSQQIRLKRRS